MERLPSPLRARVAVLLQGRCVAVAEATRRGAWAGSERADEALWCSMLATHFPVALEFAAEERGRKEAKRLYVEMATAGFLRPVSGRCRRGQLRLKAGTTCGLSVCLPLRAEEVFVLLRLQADPERPSLSGSWPLVGLMEASDEAMALLLGRQAAPPPAVDVSERADIWSLCLLDDWVWSRNTFVRCPHLVPWGCGFSDPAEVGISLRRGQVSFFRRRVGAAWTSTGVVYDAGAARGASSARASAEAAAGAVATPSSVAGRLVRPVVVGSEDGRVVVEFVGLLPRSPFEALRCEEALIGPWQTG